MFIRWATIALTTGASLVLSRWFAEAGLPRIRYATFGTPSAAALRPSNWQTSIVRSSNDRSVTRIRSGDTIDRTRSATSWRPTGRPTAGQRSSFGPPLPVNAWLWQSLPMDPHGVR